MEWGAIAFSIALHAAAAAKSHQSCPTLCDAIGGSLPGSSVHGIFQARVLEWGDPHFSSDSRLSAYNVGDLGSVPGVAKSQTRLSNFTFNFHFPLSCIGEGNGNPLQCSCLENPRDGGAWWAAVYGVAQSWTWLKRLSSNSRGSSSSSSNVLWYISVLIWMKSNLYIFIAIYMFGIISKKSLLNAILWSFSPVFSSTTFIVLLIALKVLDPFGSIFVEGKLSLFHCWVLCWLWFFIWLLLCWDFP